MIKEDLSECGFKLKTAEQRVNEKKCYEESSQVLKYAKSIESCMNANIQFGQKEWVIHGFNSNYKHIDIKELSDEIKVQLLRIIECAGYGVYVDIDDDGDVYFRICIISNNCEISSKKQNDIAFKFKTSAERIKENEWYKNGEKIDKYAMAIEKYLEQNIEQFSWTVVGFFIDGNYLKIDNLSNVEINKLIKIFNESGYNCYIMKEALTSNKKYLSISIPSSMYV